jgi:hypothetical protein
MANTGPRWITASEASVGELQTSTVTVTDAQIKTLPSVPVQIVVPTEILNYESLPQELAFPFFTIATLNNGVPYTNVTDGSSLLLAWGSGWDLACQYSTRMDSESFARTNMNGIFNGGPPPSIIGFNGPVLTDGSLLNPMLSDNGLYLAMNNSDGNLTGGDPANTLVITTNYRFIPL